MIESIRKSDHRPVTIEFTLRSVNQSGKVGSPCTLKLSSIEVVFDNGDEADSMKVCCPLPCEDVEWEKRQVDLEMPCHVDDHSARRLLNRLLEQAGIILYAFSRVERFVAWNTECMRTHY